MSGTSADGADAALVSLPGDPRALELLGFRSDPFEEALRERVHRAASGAVELRELVSLHRELGERFARCVLDLLRDTALSAREVAGIGCHGQTVGHFPERAVAGTLQIGSAAVIHERTGIPVISDFRSADLAAGGEGAPLTPFFHQAYFASAEERRAVLNIGGFTNVTYLGDVEPEALVAFDPGPGNALLDRAARWASGGQERFDPEGQRALRGRVMGELLEELLLHPYFSRSPPKSTGHEQFGEQFFERCRKRALEIGGKQDDLLATLAALTVESVARAAERFFPRPAERWILYGGGACNRAILEGLRKRLAPVPVDLSEAHGIPGGALEAIAFAVLGHASARGEPGNLPEATGAARRVVLGSATPPCAFGVRRDR